MLIKSAIFGVIVLASGIFFANEITQFLPATSTNFLDSIKDDFGKIKDDTVQNAENRVEGTIVIVTNEVNEFQEKSTELLSKSAKELTDSTQKGIREITDSTQNTFFGRGSGGGGGGGSHSTPNNQNGNSQTTSNNQNGNSQTTSNNQNGNSNKDFNLKTGRNNSTGNFFPPTDFSPRTPTNQNVVSFDTLSLSTTQQSNDNVMLRYEDTSGKTNSVSVTLRTTERELFSGIFYSSSFETFVNDASNTAYFIDMVIVHQELGIISSSVYNPRDSPGTLINGVFSKS